MEYYYGDQVKRNVIGGTRRTHGRDEKYIQKFRSDIPKGIDHSRKTGVEGRIILEWVLGK
jgi:hypothetical protein